ncbi:MAG TPA: UDP-2,3-diacylglucosamine diphosphatase [Methanocella sp.]|nr:UDP-2,3-diacylglucosamine diphosphatase [Methanocella sp.]
MIIVVSDVHLGYDRSNKEDFVSFLDKCNTQEIEHLVLLGDIFDFWRLSRADVFIKNDDVFQKLNSLQAENIHYVVGNHDFLLFKLYNEHITDYPFVITKFLRLENGGKKFFFIHGYDLEVARRPITIENYEKFAEHMCFNTNLYDKIASILWNYIGNISTINTRIHMAISSPHKRASIDRVYELSVSSSVRLLLGMQSDEILVYGHTHKPFIFNDKVVNTGSWVNEIPNKSFQNSYVKIVDGKIELKYYNRENNSL